MTQAGHSHAVPVARACPGATSCWPRWLWTPGGAPYWQGAAQHRWWSRPSPAATGQLCAPHGPRAWSCPGSRPAAPPGQPTPWGRQSPQPCCSGWWQGDSAHLWPASPSQGQGRVGRWVGQPWLLCLGRVVGRGFSTSLACRPCCTSWWQGHSSGVLCRIKHIFLKMGCDPSYGTLPAPAVLPRLHLDPLLGARCFHASVGVLARGGTGQAAGARPQAHGRPLPGPRAVLC